MSAVRDVSEDELSEDFVALKGSPANDDDLRPEDAFWAVLMGDVPEHEEDV